jgi:pyrroline-5-carboxylate reductase
MKAVIIGAGNLGGAIACGLARGTFMNAEDITCVDPNPAALEKMKETGLPFRLTSNLREVIPEMDLVFLATKKHVAREIIEQVRDLLDYKRQIFLSTVAALSFEEIENYLFDGWDIPIADRPKLFHFRIMPNIAIEMGESMTFISPRHANAAQIKLAEAMFSEMGRTMVVPEKLLPAAMAVGSCGIAYAMRYVRASMIGAIEAGFNARDAHAIVLQTVKGAIDLLAAGGEHPEVEIDRVVTPGGFTIRGLNAMEENGFSTSVIEGIRASYKDAK